MTSPSPVVLNDSTGSLAVIAPELGGWLLRYARPTAKHGLNLEAKIRSRMAA